MAARLAAERTARARATGFAAVAPGPWGAPVVASMRGTLRRAG